MIVLYGYDCATWLDEPAQMVRGLGLGLRLGLGLGIGIWC